MQKISVKREQSQAGLSFAERKNFRPQVKNKLLLLLALLLTAATGAWAQEQWDVVWDFTAWSTETVTALKADAAASKLEGWSDVEKEADAEAGADPTAATKDNCFWSCSGTVNADGNLSANGVVIKEFQGLKFNSDYAAQRKLAIAVNYPSTSLGTYHGPAYLYLGGSNQTCFTIPGVKAGSKITIEVESDKTSSARGIGLYKNSYAAENLIGEQFTPKTFEAKTWEIAEDCNVVVYNTNRCHIYTIKVKAPAAAPADYTVSMKDGVKDADKWTVKVGEGEAQALPIGGLKGDGSETVTLQYNGRLKVKGVKATSDAAAAEEADPLAVPMTIEAITAGSIKVTNPKEGMQYSLDGGKTKNAVTTDDIVLNVGDKVQFYGNGTSITSYDGTIITSSGDGFTCKVYGNIMSLVDETGFATATTLSANNTFYSLFSDFITLTDASGLLLPATQLAANCYYSMFYGCTALTAAPALPATKLANNCYQQMFRGCARLTTAPELPATQLSNNCYYRMFQGCASLTTAPALPATQLASSCYREMFSICTALTASPVLPAETLVSNCYNQMFYNCSKLATVTCLATSGINQSGSTTRWLQSAGTQAEDTKTIYTVSTADWPTINNNGIPDGWQRVNVDN